MSNPNQRGVSQVDDDDDDEAAFHSADEGEDDIHTDDTPPGDTHQPPPLVPPNVPPAIPDEPPTMTVPKAPPVAQTNEPAEKSLGSPDGDGWDLDDWDAGADDEKSGGHSDSVADVMSTPSSEKPSPIAPQRYVSERMVPVETMRAEQSTAQKPASLWGGWGQQLLSLATDSISNLTTSVGEGLTSVLETMETTIGAPTPEELAQLSLKERDALRKKADEVKEPAPVGERDDCDSASEDVSSEGGSDAGATRSDKEDALSSGYQSDTLVHQRNAEGRDNMDQPFASLFSGMSHLLENTGKTLVSGSLDVLETLGKKTFETVTTKESGEAQRRRLKIPIPSTMDRSDKPTLSQILRELKEKAENEAKLKQQEQEARKCNYAALFEDAQGLVYLEALELLSATCCQQTRSLMELLTPDQIEEVASSMDNLKSLFDAEAAKDVLGEEIQETNFEFAVKRDLRLTAVSPNRLLSLDFEARASITKLIEQQSDGESRDAKEIYEKCMQTLATFTAASVDTYHRTGQLMLVPNTITSTSLNLEDDRSVRSLASFTRTLSDELAFLSSRFTTALSAASDDSQEPDALSRMLTNVFYEASNSAGYVQEAFKLMLPIAQVANIRERLR